MTTTISVHMLDRLYRATLDRARAESPSLDVEHPDWIVCGLNGCEFAVEWGEGRTMALHKSDEDHEVWREVRATATLSEQMDADRQEATDE